MLARLCPAGPLATLQAPDEANRRPARQPQTWALARRPKGSNYLAAGEPPMQTGRSRDESISGARAVEGARQLVSFLGPSPSRLGRFRPIQPVRVAGRFVAALLARRAKWAALMRAPVGLHLSSFAS